MFFKPFEMPVPPIFPERYFDIRDFGAAAGADIKSTNAINAAIDHCSETGGGYVIIPAGKWLSGAIHLKDNVNLRLEEGCVLHFSEDFEDYLPTVYGILAGTRCYSPSHFIYAYKCKNIAVSGKGVADGHGNSWWHMKKNCPGMYDLIKKGKALSPLSERVYDRPEDGVRPRVLIEGVTFKNSPSWTVHPAWCRNIIVRNIVIRNPEDSPNTDGVNLESCKRALVEYIDVKTGDDVCCLKAGRDEDSWEVGVACEDVVIRHIKGTGGHGGFTVGSETGAGIRNAYIHDCIFDGEFYSGLRLKTMKGRGGCVENIDCENILISNSWSSAVHMTMKYTGEPLDDKSNPNINMPVVRNISVKGLKCKNAACGITVIGEDGYEMQNICFSDTEICSETALKIENTKELNFDNVTFLRNSQMGEGGK